MATSILYRCWETTLCSTSTGRWLPSLSPQLSTSVLLGRYVCICTCMYIIYPNRTLYMCRQGPQTECTQSLLFHRLHWLRPQDPQCGRPGLLLCAMQSGARQSLYVFLHIHSRYMYMSILLGPSITFLPPLLSTRPGLQGPQPECVRSNRTSLSPFPTTELYRCLQDLHCDPIMPVCQRQDVQCHSGSPNSKRHT